MKNIIVFVAVVIGLLAYDTLQAQLIIDAQYRPRTEFRDGYKTLPSSYDPAFFVDQRLRLGVHYKTKKYKLNIGLQDVRVWGAERQLVVDDGKHTTIHEANVELYCNDANTFKIGKQALVYDDHRILGSVGWAQQARSHDAMVYKYKRNKFNFHVGAAFNQDKSKLSSTYYPITGNYKTMQYLWLNNKWDEFKLSALFLNNGLQDNCVGCDKTRYSQTAGIHTVTKQGIVKTSISGYYQFGKTNSNQDLSAYEAMLEININPAPWNIILGYEYLSGNDQGATSTTNTAFTPFYGTNHKFNGHMDYFYVGNHGNSVGLQDAFLKFKYGKNGWKAGADVHYFQSAADIVNPSNNVVDKPLGFELDLSVGRKLAPDAVVKIGYSSMFGTESLELLKGGDSDRLTNWAWVMLDITPTIFKSK